MHNTYFISQKHEVHLQLWIVWISGFHLLLHGELLLNGRGINIIPPFTQGDEKQPTKFFSKQHEKNEVVR